jgi:hypothetical protein
MIPHPPFPFGSSIHHAPIPGGLAVERTIDDPVETNDAASSWTEGGGDGAEGGPRGADSIMHDM